MKVNTELAAQVYNHITLHPEAHDQEVVAEGVDYLPNGNVCGTTACIAGWTCAYAGKLEGVKDIYGRDDYIDHSDWFEDAREALGISVRLAEELFASYLPEYHARAALGLLAAGGGSERAAQRYLDNLDTYDG